MRCRKQSWIKLGCIYISAGFVFVILKKKSEYKLNPVRGCDVESSKSEDKTSQVESEVGEGVTEFSLSVIEAPKKKCLAAESREKVNKQIVSLYQYINTNSHSLH